MGLDRVVHAVDKGLQIAQLVVWLIDQNIVSGHFAFRFRQLPPLDWLAWATLEPLFSLVPTWTHTGSGRWPQQDGWADNCHSCAHPDPGDCALLLSARTQARRSSSAMVWRSHERLWRDSLHRYRSSGRRLLHKCPRASSCQKCWTGNGQLQLDNRSLHIYMCWLCFGQAGNLGINLNATLLHCNSHFQDLSSWLVHSLWQFTGSGLPMPQSLIKTWM